MKNILLSLMLLVVIIGVFIVHDQVALLDKRVSLMVDVMKEQAIINNNIIEILRLREDPQYIREVTDCNKRYMKKSN